MVEGGRTMPGYVVAVGARSVVEDYLYACNRIVSAYERDGSGAYVIECADDAGFGAKAQGMRLGSGLMGGVVHPTREGAERAAEAQFRLLFGGG